IYTSNWSSLGRLNNNGGTYTYESLTLPGGLGSVSIYGIAWMPYDEDDMPLWLFGQPNSNAVVYRMAPDGSVYDDVGYEVYANGEAISGGIDISLDYDPSHWAITTFAQATNTDDFIDIWEGYEESTWLWIDEATQEGSIEVGGDADEVIIHADITELEYREDLEHGDMAEAEVIVNGPHFMDPLVVNLIVWFNLGVGDGEAGLPTEYALHQNYPNPFNPTTTIKFDLVEAQNVKLAVYNILGQQVMTLVNRRMDAGYHAVNFDARNLSSGMYFYRIEAGQFKSMKKMVMVK
ncbi:T9SS type A sorting domain-containing protein, partial [bacterium]|nr:T9SS type A sorting domain-containing protein [bacterium]